MRVPGLQTGVCSQPEDRCACVLCPGPEPVVCCALPVHWAPVRLGVVRDGACRARILRARLCPRCPAVGGRLWVGSWLACAWCALASRRGLCGRLRWSSPRLFRLGTPWAPAVWQAWGGWGLRAGRLCIPGQAVFILKRAARFGRGSCGCVPCCCSPQLLWALRNLQPQKCGWTPLPLQCCSGWPGLQ